MSGDTKVITCGCRFNRFESAEIESRLKNRSNHEVVVVNSCAVTQIAEAKSRRAIRRAIRENPSASIVVAGCWAELDPEAVIAVEGVSLVLGNEEKFDAADYLNRGGAFTGAVQKATAFTEQTVGVMGGRTAAYLKIQNGCGEKCSYCAVRLVRGKNRSAAMEFVLQKVDDLIANGVREIVLTGINIGAYGKEFDEKTPLAGLLSEISRRDGARFRISSINPNDVTGEMISVMADSPNICRHLHIPMQSGSDTILKKMKRPYSASQYRKKIEEIADKIPGIALGCDVMAGFPGETAEDFRLTQRMLAELPFSYAHLFPYSGREKTVAYNMPGAVPPPLIKERTQKLKEAAANKNKLYRKSLIGRTLQVLVERRASNNGLLKGKSDNFVQVEFRGAAGLKGELVNVAVTGLTEKGIEGKTVWAT